MKNIFLSLSVLLLLFSCKKQEQPEQMSQTFVLSSKMLATTKVEKAKYENLKNELNYYGKITADNNKLIEVFPVVGGNVTQVFVELGDYVQKGKVLALIRSMEVAGFENEMEDAKNDVVVAKNNLKVVQDLVEGNLNTEQELLEAKSQLQKAEAHLQRISETYKIYNLKKGAIYEVRSPIDGFIIQKNINQNMLLRSDKTDNIFDIAEINDVWAIANVNETDISQIKLGIDASVTTLSYPDSIFYGKVDKIYSVIDPETKSMKVRIKLHNNKFLLKPEMRANIKLSYTDNDQMIAVPSAAIIFDKSKNFVMIFKDRNNITTKQVEVFRQLGNTTYISSGLKEGEQVITANQLLIYDALND